MRVLVPTREQQTLLLQAAFLQDARAGQAWTAWNTTINWDEHLDADSFRLLPQVYHNLSARLPDEPVFGKLRGIARKAWYQNQMLWHAVTPLFGSLNANGIETRLVYGAPLSLHYKDADLNIGSTFGLWVQSAQAAAAVQCLRANGWQAMPALKAETLERYFAARDFHVFVQAEQQLTVQWRMLPGTDSQVWDATEPRETGGVAFHTLNPTAQLLLALLAGPRPTPNGYFARAIEAMLWLKTAGSIEWARFAAWARAQKALPIAAGMLVQLAEKLEAPIPDKVVEGLRRDALPEAELHAQLDAGAQASRTARLWNEYARHARGSGFPAYLRDRWQLEHTYDVPRAALKRLRGRT